MVIHESVLEDKSTRSELTIRNLSQSDVGRGMVYAQNIHNTIQCQFSVLLVSNEEPAPVTDFRFNLKNRVSSTGLFLRIFNIRDRPLWDQTDQVSNVYFRSRQKQ